MGSEGKRFQLFTGEYEALALFIKQLYPEKRITADELRLKDEAALAAAPKRWVVLGRDSIQALLTLWHRPDGRYFLSFDYTLEDESSLQSLLEVAEAYLAHLEVTQLFTTTKARDDFKNMFLERRGFRVLRREGSFVLEPEDIPSKSLELLQRAYARVRKYGVDIVSLHELKEDAKRDYKLWLLDNTLRQKVPGTVGWQWTFEQFLQETVQSKAFNDKTYFVAVHEDEYIGLVRIWLNPTGPRLGLIAVLPSYQKRGVSLALAWHAINVCKQWGLNSIVSESDFDNDAIQAFHKLLESRLIEETLEWVKNTNVI